MTILKNVGNGASLCLTGLGSLYCLSNSISSLKKAAEGSQSSKQRNQRIIQRHLSYFFGEADSKVSCIVRDLFEASLWTVNAIGLGMLSLQFAQIQRNSSQGLSAENIFNFFQGREAPSLVSKISSFVPGFLKDPYFLASAVFLFGGTTLVERIQAFVSSFNQKNDSYKTPAPSPHKGASAGKPPQSPYIQLIRDTPRAIKEDFGKSPFSRAFNGLPKLTQTAYARVQSSSEGLRVKLRMLYRNGVGGE